jgi:hypothetical protein
VAKKVGHWPVERWLALGAFAVSIVALGISLQQMRDVRLHDRPRFGYSYRWNDSGAGWRLKNSGLGQARLRGFKLLVDGKSINDLTNLFPALGFSGPVRFTFTNPLAGELYAPGWENDLIKVTPGPEAEQLNREWTRVEIQACYCSIYDECWLFSIQHAASSTGEDQRDDKCSTFQGEEHTRWWEG